MQSVTDREPTTAEKRKDEPLRIRYRIRFAKTGLLRWISHRDLARLWERLVRRADLKLSMTEGFHPKPRIAFPSALALGVEGLDEVVELELAERLDATELLSRLRRDEQPGLEITSVVQLPDGFGKAQLLASDYRIEIPLKTDRQQLQQSIEEFLNRGPVTVSRKNKTFTAEVSSQVRQLEVVDQHLQLSLAACDSASLRPVEILELIDAGHWIESGCAVQRVRVILEKDLSADHSLESLPNADSISGDAGK